MLKVADHLDFLIVKTESESLYLENNLIKKYQPFYNRMLKGGNGYAYITLTNHPFAQVLVTMKKKDDHSIYIGPKHHTKELKNFLQYLRMVLQYRTCPITQFLKKKVCSDYYFQLCKGWCEDCPQRDDMQQKLSHDEAKEQYKKLIQTFSSFFKGNIQPIEKELKSQIEEAVKIQNFEWAAKLRDIYLHLAQLVEKQNVELSKQITGSILSLKRIGKQAFYGCDGLDTLNIPANITEIRTDAFNLCRGLTFVNLEDCEEPLTIDNNFMNCEFFKPVIK